MAIKSEHLRSDSPLEQAFSAMCFGHWQGCEIDHTDVCTCGANEAKQAFITMLDKKLREKPALEISDERFVAAAANTLRSGFKFAGTGAFAAFCLHAGIKVPGRTDR